MSVKDGWVATVRVSLSASLSGPSVLVNRVPLISFLIRAILYKFGMQHPPCKEVPVSLANSHVSGKGGLVQT